MAYKKFIINKSQAIERMNDWGKMKKSFFFMTSFDQEENLVLDEQMVKQAGIHCEMPLWKSGSYKKAVNLPSPLIFEKEPLSQQEFAESFDIVKKHLNFGNSYLVNLTKPSKIQTNLSLEQIFHYSKAPYRLWIENKLVVFSPEIFIKAGNGKISSYPMKGTIDANIPNAQNIILQNKKELSNQKWMSLKILFKKN